MMLKLLLYGYATGVTSSREIERRCRRDVAFRWLAANEAPDYRSISRFRRRHLDALRPLFLQVLGLCAKAGLVRLGRVALDGTKLDANASRHKAMSYDHIVPEDRRAPGRGRRDARRGRGDRPGRGRGLSARTAGATSSPAELARRESRLAKLRAAKEAIEQEARDKAEAAARKKGRAAGKAPRTRSTPPARPRPRGRRRSPRPSAASPIPRRG